MKLQAITLVSLLALSASASANWFDGFNNGMGNGNGYGNAAGNTNGAGNAAGNGNATGNGWGTAKGDADGEVDFSITFKGKGRTDMDTAGNLTGQGQGTGNTDGKFTGNGTTDANMAGNGSNQANSSSQGSNMPWNNSFTGNNGSAQAPRFAPAGFSPSAAPAVDYVQLKAMWEAQRKQADQMLKRIEAAQKAAK